MMPKRDGGIRSRSPSEHFLKARLEECVAVAAPSLDAAAAATVASAFFAHCDEEGLTLEQCYQVLEAWSEWMKSDPHALISILD